MMALMLIAVVKRQLNDASTEVIYRRVSSDEWSFIALPVQVDDLENEPEEQLIELAKRQHDVLCHFIQMGDVLPVALGSAFSNEMELLASMNDKSTELREAFSKFEGRCEYTISLKESGGDARSPSVARTGSEHLRKRRMQRDLRQRQHKLRGQLIEELKTKVESSADKLHIRKGSKRDDFVSLDVLINRNRLSAFIEDLSGLDEAASLLGLNFNVVGPYPAFTFSRIGAING